MQKHQKVASAIRWVASSLFVPTFTILSASAGLANDYFEGKAIRLIVPFAVGGDTDLLSRVIAAKMSKNLPSNPKIFVENKPGAGGALALNYLYNAAGSDGLTILGMGSNAVMDQLLRPASVKFDLAKFKYVGGAGPILQVLAGQTDSPIKTLADFGKLGRRVAIAGGGPSSMSTIVGRLLKRLYPNVTVTVGYLGENDRYKALLLGEADAALVGASYLRGEKAGLPPFVWMQGKVKGWTDTPNLGELNLPPEMRSFLKVITAPAQYGRTYIAPPGTSTVPMALLQKAFELTLKDPDFLEIASRIGAEDLQWQSPADIVAAYSQVLETSSEALKGLQNILNE
jgi:tripartite-type tricarboxylate transporter receptor subunit TctC